MPHPQDLQAAGHTLTGRKQQRVYNVDSPVSAGKIRRRWTPSTMRGRGAVKPRWGKRSERPGSRGRSPAAWCPTNVLRLRWGWSGQGADV